MVRTLATFATDHPSFQPRLSKDINPACTLLHGWCQYGCWQVEMDEASSIHRQISIMKRKSRIFEYATIRPDQMQPGAIPRRDT